MEDICFCNQFKIHYKSIGKGNCIVLLHGYMENLNIWNGFSDDLSANYHVIIPDIPIHGQSESEEEVNTIERMSDSISALIDYLKISKVLLVGHSMGGYVALSLAEQFPKKIAGLCLLHSTPNADSEEKKQSRLLEIDEIKQGKKAEVVSRAVPLRFSTKNLLTHKVVVDWTINIALGTSDNGVITSIKAMASRSNYNHVLVNANFPTMMIFGEQDNHIPLSVAKQLESTYEKTRTVYLHNSGHMGFLEEKDQALNAIRSFAACVFS